MAQLTRAITAVVKNPEMSDRTRVRPRAGTVSLGADAIEKAAGIGAAARRVRKLIVYESAPSPLTGQGRETVSLTIF